ncbi:hypothetical protein ES332_D13G291600v1 [Gossypium tomentosum]|uniref:Uncharacterized protein n=1 Tax=Gossypium tomentosum TaxID=34277 RepID=A0A5D2I2P1_GOSTO|nr:hypothetical protein ES332_D13G291600v1 [Gossypium tomentosum]
MHLKLAPNSIPCAVRHVFAIFCLFSWLRSMADVMRLEEAKGVNGYKVPGDVGASGAGGRADGYECGGGSKNKVKVKS